ncbi:ABC transporter ATP-binding protein [Laribacter hongkongensis]|nr:nitrate/sulfonate/bicarbonate ABC transporter ATP-binding protein [Laribacter hongkongensis]MCG9039975.1 nitrate/sulfonate/bicarbonate ABC transporter ATP-binding protein [Laribacter hongkongensis]
MMEKHGEHPLIMELKDVSRRFARAGEAREILDGVSLNLHEGKIVGLLGRSGSGKSTLLRMIAGLIPPSSGSVLYRGQPLAGPADGVAMVFQSFALFPWLTVQENVEAGLEAQGVPAAERRERARAAIDLIGLDGFENAYPREMSGGMRQRVGFARALVVNPALLLMDEPFSALDVLTAETLRTDLIELWNSGQLPIRSMLIVTHNIEEAVFLCDRILVLSSHPGRIVAEISVPLPHRRERLDPVFRRMVDDIYALMTHPQALSGSPRAPWRLDSHLPAVPISLMTGLVEALANPPYAGRADLPDLAAQLLMPTDQLFLVADVLEQLGLVQLKTGDIMLTAQGLRFADADSQARKELFAIHLTQHVPLAARILQVLHTRPGQRAPRERFVQELEDQLSQDEADTTLDTVIDWGRYAEIFSYNDASGLLSLADVEGEH